MSKALMLSKASRKYIPKEFRGQENPPTFEVRSATRREQLKVHAEMEQKYPVDLIAALELNNRLKTLTDASKNTSATGDTAKEVSNLTQGAQSAIWALKQKNYEVALAFLNLCMSGWENLPEPFSQQNIELLDEDLIYELYVEIVGAITEEDAGNSGGPCLSENGATSKDRTAEQTGDGTAESAA